MLQLFSEPELRRFYLLWMERGLELQQQSTLARRAAGQLDFICPVRGSA
jgi:hypothetical protein